MPQTPVTQRRRTSRQASADASPIKAKTTQNTPAKGKLNESFDGLKLDIGSSRGLYDTDSIRDKVLKWQQLANDTASDVESISPLKIGRDKGKIQSDPLNTASQNRKNNEPHTTPRQYNAKANETHASKDISAQKYLDKDLKQASAPRKRVVSDEHWKKARTGKGAIEEPNKETSKAGKKLDGWVRKRPDKRRDPSTEKLEKFSRTPHRDDSPVKPSRLSDCGDAESDSGSQCDVDLPISGPPQSSGLGSKTELSKNSCRETRPSLILRKRRKSEARMHSTHNTAETRTVDYGFRNSTSAERRQKSDRRISPTGSIDREDDRDLAAEIATPPQTYGSRIEAWLTEAVDPFVEKPRHREKRRSHSRSDHSNDPYQMRRNGRLEGYDTDMPLPLNIKPKRDSPVQSRSPDTKDVFGSSGIDNSPSSPPLLRRAGAKRAIHSPNRGSPITQNEDQLSVGSSSIDGSAIDFSTVDVLNVSPNSFSRYGRRGFPSTGNRLSTIASVETFRTREMPENMVHTSNDKKDSTLRTDEVQHKSGRVSRKPSNPPPDVQANMATNADLISVLSMPEPSTQSLLSNQSVRTSKSQPIHTNLDECLKELVLEENKYIRELRTLVDGVIPVLLSCVLSKSNALIASGLFGGGKDATTPIVNMGIALERLNSIHKRVPTNSADAFLVWAQSAHRVYTDYIKAWRMGFQDVVVNLAPAESSKSSLPMTIPRKPVPGQNSTLLQNKEGDVVNAEGERVDVAFLLKRPLIRLKYLAKTLKGMHQTNPTEKTELWCSRFQDLVVKAKNKQNEERARLEDEAAANIDITRAREPQTLAPILDVKIDPSRFVRARDYFNLKLYHSTGQQVDCHVELILRDNADEGTGLGDVLICEVDTTSRWLLFPPILQENVSARKGDSKGEIVIMIRGAYPNGQEWRELLSLTSNDDEAEQEWTQMFGLHPKPPPAPSVSTFSITGHQAGEMVLANSPNMGTLTPSEYDVPMGERPTEITKRLKLVSSAVQEAPNASSPLILPKKPDRVQRPVSMPVHSSGPISPTNGSSSLNSGGNDNYLPRTSMSAQNSPVTRPKIQRHTSSVPSKDLPSVPKVRNEISNSSQAQKPPQKQHSSSSSPPRLSPRTPHRIGGSPGPRFSPPNSGSNRGRRSSSPLKHEYEPSSESDSNAGGVDSRSDDEESITSDSSAEDLVPSLLPAHAYQKQFTSKRPESLSTAPGADTISPSQSASQAPYRTVPQQPGLAPKTIASIFSWSEKGVWERLHADECSIIVSPGLIEAFEMSAAHSSNTTYSSSGSPSGRPPGTQPLIALELTPLVPLRRGTAIDISIRSPPTAESLIRSSNNIMFRSRNSQECESLYNMINQARINNPTYIALQNARGPNGESNWAQFMDRRASMRRTSSGTSSWFRFGSKRGGGYRAGSKRRVRSVSGDTESSIATMSSAFSALRRFSTNGNRMFNVAKSTITSRTGGVIGAGGNLTRSSTTFSSSGSHGSGDAVPGANDLALPPDLTMNGSTPLGLTNQKIRLYLRETAGKWLDMGSARLTIMHPPRSASSGPMTPARQMQQERRVVIIGKTQGERLLDVTLGETSFERVARTGIAVSVMERLMGPNGQEESVGKTGGVLGSRVKVYMIQLKTEAETAYTFSLVGRLRY